MPLDATALAWSLAAGIFLYAALADVAHRVIPNRAPLAIAILALGLPLVGMDGWGALAAAGVGIATFLICVPLVLRGLLGGGDAKLLAAGAALGGASHAWPFVVATVFAGGILGVLYLLGWLLLSRRPLPPRRGRRAARWRRLMRAEAWRIRGRRSVPYGVAITVGALFAIPTYP